MNRPDNLKKQQEDLNNRKGFDQGQGRDFSDALYAEGIDPDSFLSPPKHKSNTDQTNLNS